MNSSRTWAAAAVLTLGLGISVATNAAATDPSGSVTATSTDSCSVGGGVVQDGQYRSWGVTFDASETHTYTYGPRVDIGSHMLGAQISLTDLDITLPPEAVNTMTANGFSTGDITFAEENNKGVFAQMRGFVKEHFDLSQSAHLHVSGLNGIVEFGSWDMNESGRHEETYPVTLQRIDSVLTINNGKLGPIYLGCSAKQPSTSTTTTTGTTPTTPGTTTPEPSGMTPAAPSSPVATSPGTKKPVTAVPPTATGPGSAKGAHAGSATSTSGPSSPPAQTHASNGQGPRVETDRVTSRGDFAPADLATGAVIAIGTAGLAWRRQRRA